MLRSLLHTVVAFGGILGLYMLTGCSELQDRMKEIADGQDNQPRHLAFVCDHDRKFTARLSSDRDQAQVDTGSKTYELDYTGRDNGMRVYSDADKKVRLNLGHDKANLAISNESDFKDCEREGS